MRMAQVMAGAPMGGAETFFERLSAALARAGEQVLPVIRRDHARAARLRAEGLAPAELGFGGALDLRTRPRLRSLLAAFDPRVVVAWMSRAAKLTPTGRWVKVGRLGGYYDLRSYRDCDHLVGNTKDICRWITGQGWPAGRVHYLPNFSPDLSGAAPAALPEGRRVLALGRLHRNKGFDILVRAMPALPEAQVVIAGEGPERERLLDLAAELGVSARLHLTGWRSDQAALLAACDVLVCPSRIEPLGNVVLEAFSAGRPVVATTVAGPLALIDPGRTGLLVAPEDPARLAATVRTILDDAVLAASLAAAARAEWALHYAEAPVLEQWRACLAGMAG